MGVGGWFHTRLYFSVLLLEKTKTKGKRENNKPGGAINKNIIMRNKVSNYMYISGLEKCPFF